MTQKIGTLEATITTDTSGLTKGVKATDASLTKNERMLTRNAKKWDKWSASATAATVALGAAVLVGTGKVIQYGDAFTSIQNQIRQTTNNTEELAQRTQQLLDVANRSRVEFKATSELYTQLTLATEQMNLSTGDLLRLTETIGKSFAVSGKSAAESAGAIRQLGQAFSAGALRGDEFNSIAEGAPEIMRALQRSLGLTQGKLRDLAATGGITAEILVTALQGAADVIDDKMTKAVKTLSQSMQEAENNAIAFVGASESISGGMSLAGDAIVSMSENLDVLANVALTAVAVGFARVSSAMIINTTATIRNTIAQTVQTTSVSRLASVTGEQIKTTIRYTAAQRAATIATGALRGSMALLGGPVGIAILAATAIIAYTNSESDAEKVTERLTEKVKAQKKALDDLGKSQADLAEEKILTTKERIEQLNASVKIFEQRAIDATRSIRHVGSGFSIWQGKISDAKDELIELKKQMNLQKESADLAKQLADTTDKPKGDTSSPLGVSDEELKKLKAVDAFWQRLIAVQDEAAKKKIEHAAKDKELRIAEEEENQRVLSDFEKQTATQRELEDILHAEDLERLRSTFKDKQNLTAEEQAIEKALISQHEQSITDIKKQENEMRRQIFARDAGAVLNAIGALGKKSLKIQKAVSLAQAAVAIATGIARANELGFPANIGEIARVVAVGASAISSIKSASVGGGGSTPSGHGGSSGGGSSPQQAPTPQQAPQVNNALDINITGEGLLSVQQLRGIMAQMNEQLGDGVQLNITTGA